MFEKGTLTINYDTWKDGIASSLYVGCGDLRNADIFSKPGVLQCGYKATKESGSVVTNFIRFMRQDESNNKVYGGDDSGKLYSRSSDGTWAEALTGGGTSWSEADECNGLEFWKGHILFAEDLKLHVYDIDTFWYADWQTFAEGKRNLIDLPHVMHIGQDDVVYITDGRYLASLQEVAGQTFDPSDSNTYTWNDEALDLPEGYVASTLSELGTYLVIGTYFNEVLNRGNRAELFPWDRTSASFNIPQRTKGNGVWQSVSQGNILYTIFDRTNAKVYASNLTTLELQRELRVIQSELTLHPDAIEIFNDEILTGIGADGATVDRLGVYSYRDEVLQLRNTLSIGDTDMEVGSILNIGNGEFIASWSDGTTHGVDVISDTRYTGYATVLESEMHTVGTTLNPYSFTQMDLLLGRKLATGQGVRVSYRESLDDSWTVLQTLDFATYAAVNKINEKSSLDGLTTVQIRVELTAAADSTASPEFLSLSLF